MVCLYMFCSLLLSPKRSKHLLQNNRLGPFHNPMVSGLSLDSGKTAKQLNEYLWVFPPNKLCNGSRSWWIDCDPEPILIDCPPVSKNNIDLLEQLSSGRTARIVLTNREAHGEIGDLQNALGWPVLVQEQEAYLLPGLKKLESFVDEHITESGMRLIWTPGPTPGSCVAFAPEPLNVLFCGRLLIPKKSNFLVAVRTKRTFHWTRYQKSLTKIRQFMPLDVRPRLASGVGLNEAGGGKLYEWNEWINP